MTIPAIDNISNVLFVSKVNAQANAQPRQLANRTSFETSIAPSRSKDLTQQAVNKGVLVNSILEEIFSLITTAEKTTLPTNYPEISRVTLQADISTLLKSLETVINSSEIGSVSLLRSDTRTLLLESNELGGSIKVEGIAIDADALGLSKINILSDLGLKDASSRINNALYALKERLGRIGNLNEALNNHVNYGNLINTGGYGTSLGSSVAHNLTVGPSTYSPPISYGGAVTGQYAASQFNRGSFVNLIG